MEQSAGILLYRRRQQGVEVFLVHPGGPFWKSKDHGAWTVPKGRVHPGEEPLAAAQREFTEETSFIAQGDFLALGEIMQSRSKRVLCWAVEGDCDPARLVSNTCLVEWPPRSGRRIEIPEVDRGEWFTMDEAAVRILKNQQFFLTTLSELMARR